METTRVPAPGLTWRHPAEEELPGLYPMLIAAYRRANPRFPEDPSFFARYTQADPHHRPGLWLVGELGHEPVTALRIAPREVYLPRGGRARVAGVANVATHPAHVGRGYASELLRRALAFMEQEGFGLSFLFTSGHGLYEREGWRRLRLPVRRRALFEPLAPPSHSPYRMRAVAAGGAPAGPAETEAPDWAALASLYAHTHGGFPGALLRDAGYWERWIGGLMLERAGFTLYIARRGGALAAYLAGCVKADPAAPSGRQLEVAEGGALPGALEGLVHLASLAGAGTGALVWPDLPWLNAALESFPGVTQATDRDGGMARTLGAGQELPRVKFLPSALDRF